MGQESRQVEQGGEAAGHAVRVAWMRWERPDAMARRNGTTRSRSGRLGIPGMTTRLECGWPVDVGGIEEGYAPGRTYPGHTEGHSTLNIVYRTHTRQAAASRDWAALHESMPRGMQWRARKVLTLGSIREGTETILCELTTSVQVKSRATPACTFIINETLARAYIGMVVSANGFRPGKCNRPTVHQSVASSGPPASLLSPTYQNPA